MPTTFELQAANSGQTMHPGAGDAFETLIAWLDPGARDTVLDLGCGSGEAAIALTERSGCRVIGVDHSSYLVHLARERARLRGLEHRVSFVVADAELLPFGRAFADRVLVQSVLSLVGCPARALSELRRTLRRGAWMGLNEVVDGPGVRPGRVSPRLRARGWAEFQLRPRDQWHALVEAAGFEVVTQRTTPGVWDLAPRDACAWFTYLLRKAWRVLRSGPARPATWGLVLTFLDELRVQGFRRVPYSLMLVRSTGAGRQ